MKNHCSDKIFFLIDDDSLIKISWPFFAKLKNFDFFIYSSLPQFFLDIERLLVHEVKIQKIVLFIDLFLENNQEFLFDAHLLALKTAKDKLKNSFPHIPSFCYVTTGHLNHPLVETVRPYVDGICDKKFPEHLL